MGNTANWEFAAAVAAVAIGLGGLLLFSVVAIIGSLRVFERASLAAAESAAASGMVRDLMRSLEERNAVGAAGEAASPGGALSELRREADALREEQRRLREEARALAGADPAQPVYGERFQQLEEAVGQLEEQLSEIAAAVANEMASANARERR